MANGGPKTNGSQFFITHKETPWLNDIHTVFGEVVKGIEVVDTIANVEVGEGDKPVTDVVINTVVIIRNSKEAKSFDAVEVMTEYFAEEEAEAAAMQKMIDDFVALTKKQKEEARTYPSGLKIMVLKDGNGEKPKYGQQVLVKYAGWLTDGALFDTSEAQIAEEFGQYARIIQMHRGVLKPSRMNYSPDANLIAGFKEGLLTMKIGDKVRLFIPPHLGYGPQGGGPIPPNAELIFDLEIISVAE